MKKRYLAVVVLGLAPMSALASSKAIKAECGLYKAAYEITERAGVTPKQDILVDCPGYEHFKEQMTRRDNSRAFRKAMSTKVPDKAKAWGKKGKLYFQKMISRGVPPEVAVHIVEKTKHFERALAVLGK